MRPSYYQTTPAQGKRITLTMREITMALPRLVQAFSTPACFTVEEAAHALGKSKGAVRNDIKYLLRAGYVTPVRKGLYGFTPEKTGRSADRYVLASKVAKPSMMSYHSALELHGVAQSALYTIVYLGTTKRVEGFDYRDTTFKPVLTPPDLIDLGAEPVKRTGLTIQVACRELALLQCADRLRYAGGFEELLKSVEGFPYLNWKRLSTLLGAYGKTALYRKAGFIVDTFADRWKAPEEVLSALASKTGKGFTYFGTQSRRGGRLIARWQVIVPKNWQGVLEVG